MDYSNLSGLLLMFVISLMKRLSCQELLDVPLTWKDANVSCSLLNQTETIVVSNIIPNGTSAWIGKRRDFKNWLSLQDCGSFILSQNQFTRINITGKSYVQECQEGCSGLFQSGNGGFGLENNRGIECICFAPRQFQRIQLRVGNCNLNSCGTDANLDLCAGKGEIIIYNELPSASFIGPGECAAFQRTSPGTFKQLALPCYEEHGYLQEIPSLFSTVLYNPVTSQRDTWKQTAIESGIVPGFPRLSNREREERTWGSISLQEWPLNVTQWVAITRRSKLRPYSDQSDCLPGLCYCVAVYVDTDGRVTEELLDCKTTLPALCMNGSLRTTAAVDLEFRNTISDDIPISTTRWQQVSSYGTTRQQQVSSLVSRRSSQMYLIIGILIAIVGLIVVPCILYFLFFKWKCGKNRNSKPGMDAPQQPNQTEMNLHAIRTENNYERSIIPGETNNYEALHFTENNYERSIIPGETKDYEALHFTEGYSNIEQPSQDLPYADHSYIEIIDGTNLDDVSIVGNDKTSLMKESF